MSVRISNVHEFDTSDHEPLPPASQEYEHVPEYPDSQLPAGIPAFVSGSEQFEIVVLGHCKLHAEVVKLPLVE